MSATESADLQDIAIGRLASQSDQPARPTVLPPFCGTLKEDEGLNLSNQNFKQSIDYFFKDKNITPLSQLTATSPFPTPHVLVQFAYNAYRDYETRETDAQYETRLALPDGWELLTTASNSSMGNGYFGAAYWHPEHQQVVIAHRGTDIRSYGALWTDVNGVIHNRYVPQMYSASTFTHKVVEVLREVNRTKGVSFQLFFTGHCLGGWLAQITTFTTEYLKREGNIFLKNNNKHDSNHPHTVVFNSPGCKYMLSQMKDTFDVRHDGRSIVLKHLDITSYLTAPNRINTCNKHVGTVFRIFTDLSDMGWLEKHTVLYNLATQSMDKIFQAFDFETGQVRKDERGGFKIQVVVDWPVTAGFSCGSEYKHFFKWAEHLNDYHPYIEDVAFQIEGYHPLRYQTRAYDERVSRLSVFSQEECQFLQDYYRLRQSPERFKLKQLFSVMKDNKAQEEAERKLQSFEIENDRICCPDASELQALFPHVKRLLQLFPEVKENTKIALSSEESRKDFYQLQTRNYFEQVNQSPLKFRPEVLNLTEFLISDNLQVLHVQMVDGEGRTGLNKVYQVLQENVCFIEGQYNILTLRLSVTVKELMDLNTLMLSTVTPYILLMACESNQLLNDEEQDIIRTLFKTIKEKPFVKFILTTPSHGGIVPRLQEICRDIFGTGFVTRNGDLNLE
jgi:hypothetical protein